MYWKTELRACSIVANVRLRSRSFSNEAPDEFGAIRVAGRRDRNWAWCSIERGAGVISEQHSLTQTTAAGT